MLIKFESSGTHVHKEQLKIRLDLYPDVGEKSYAQNYVYVPVIPESGYPGKVDEMGSPVDQKDYDLWEAGLPHIWQLNPCLSVFVKVDENITKTLLTQFCVDILKSDVLATIDDAMIQLNSAHLISPYMNSKQSPKTQLSLAKTTVFDEQSKIYIDNLLKDFSIGTSLGGTVEDIKPGSIDVGPGAVSRASSQGTTFTMVDRNNAANADGTLDTMEFYFTSGGDGSNVKCGTFSHSDSTHAAMRDYETIGTVTKGSKQTFTGLNCDVVTDDYLGIYYTGGYLYQVGSGNSGYMRSGYLSNYFTDNNAHNYNDVANAALSLYATGTEAGGGWVNIGKVGGIAAASVGKINGITNTSIGKLNGVAV
jgi:hypothetical protein